MGKSYKELKNGRNKKKLSFSSKVLIFLISIILIFVTIGVLFQTYASKNLRNTGAIIAILSNDKYRAELKANGILGDETLTNLSSSMIKSEEKSSKSSNSKGTNLDKFMLSSVKGYGNDVDESKFASAFSSVGGKAKDVMKVAEDQDINLLSFLIISKLEGGGAGNYINHFAVDTSSDPVQMMKDDFVIFAGERGTPVANGGTLPVSAMDTDEQAWDYSTTVGFFKPGGFQDLAFTTDWSADASKNTMIENAPQGTVGRYGLYQTAAISYVAMTGKPMPALPGYPSGGPDFNSRATVEGIANQVKK